MKKIISAIIAIVTVFNFGISAYAEPETQTYVDNGISVCYLYTNKVESALSISSKTATCKSTIRGISGTTTKIVVTQTLQKENGSSWDNVTSWSKTYNSWYAIYKNTKSFLSSGTYRVKTVAKVYSGISYEIVTAYSRAVSC